MILAKVVGNIVCTQRADGIDGARYLIIDKCDQSGKRFGDYNIALDMVEAGYGELVMVAQGSSCRWTSRTDDKPIDNLIVGIIDMIDSNNKVLYQK